MYVCMHVCMYVVVMVKLVPRPNREQWSKQTMAMFYPRKRGNVQSELLPAKAVALWLEPLKQSCTIA